MSKVLIIGAGGVGRVVAFKCAQHRNVFGEIMLASRTKKKCDTIAAAIDAAYGGRKIKTAKLDADVVLQTIDLINRFKPDLVINVALPYQDLPIMDACLDTGVNYMDTANYEPKDEAKFEYSWQWAYQERYARKGIMALLGCGFDPGVTSVYTAHAAKHHFDEIHELDIVDANAGNHGKAFATNFNPEINIREVTQRGKYWQDGRWVETEPHEIWKDINYPEIGPKRSYLIFHEELESLVKHFPTLHRARFWMTFSEQYLTHLRVIQNIGMAGIHPVRIKGVDIVPLEFLKAVLPKPEELGENYTGFTSIGCRIKGVKNGKTRTCYVWNNCSHVDAYRETGTQAVSYTTGVPAMIGARMILEGKWSGKGVFNCEQLDPDPFMERLNLDGLPWHEKLDLNLEMD